MYPHETLIWMESRLRGERIAHEWHESFTEGPTWRGSPRNFPVSDASRSCFVSYSFTHSNMGQMRRPLRLQRPGSCIKHRRKIHPCSTRTQILHDVGLTWGRTCLFSTQHQSVDMAGPVTYNNVRLFSVNLTNLWELRHACESGEGAIYYHR